MSCVDLPDDIGFRCGVLFISESIAPQRLRKQQQVAGLLGRDLASKACWIL